MDAFEAALRQTLGFEGFFSDDPDDDGGPTKWGVTQATYDAWRDSIDEPRQDVRLMDVHEMRALYRAMFWDEARCGELPAVLAPAVFDMAVNSGPDDAVKALQGALGVKVDGFIGPITLRAAHERGTGALLAFFKARGAHFQKCIRERPVEVKFLGGWINRLLEQAWKGGAP